MWDKLRKQMAVSREELHLLLGTFDSLLGEMAAGREPTAVELSALGGVLNSYYNGIQNILKRIAVLVDGGAPRGASWHSELLMAMAEPAANRPPVISQEMLQQLRNYLDFRHFYVHGYTYQLTWKPMAPLVLGCQETLELFEAELDEFLKHKS